MTASICSSAMIRFITGYWFAPWTSDTSRIRAAVGWLISPGTNFSCSACDSASRFRTYGVACCARVSTSERRPALRRRVPSRPVVLKLSSLHGW